MEKITEYLIPDLPNDCSKIIIEGLNLIEKCQLLMVSKTLSVYVINIINEEYWKELLLKDFGIYYVECKPADYSFSQWYKGIVWCLIYLGDYKHVATLIPKNLELKAISSHLLCCVVQCVQKRDYVGMWGAKTFLDYVIERDLRGDINDMIKCYWKMGVSEKRKKDIIKICFILAIIYKD